MIPVRWGGAPVTATIRWIVRYFHPVELWVPGFMHSFGDYAVCVVGSG